MEFNLNLPGNTGLAPGEEAGKVFDLAILGGGPAGLTAAVYAMRKQIETVLISPDLGGQVLKTSGVENYMGYQYVTGPELGEKFSEQIRQFPIKLAVGESVTAVGQSPDTTFWMRTDAGREVKSRALILATGKRWRKLNVPGEEQYQGHGVSLCAVCDAPFFKNLPVVVAGGGNSAVTAAMDLLELNCRVTLVNMADGWQADPVLVERVRGKALLLDGYKILEIQGDGRQVQAVKAAPREGGEERVIEARGIFIEIGLLPNTEVFKNFVSLNRQGEIVADCATRTSRSGVYAAGDCTNVQEKQIIIAAGDGAKAALGVYKFLKNIPD